MSIIFTFVFIFFFFKQKTAYEMRISDWSSDVCSSDLPGQLRLRRRRDGRRGGARQGRQAARRPAPVPRERAVLLVRLSDLSRGERGAHVVVLGLRLPRPGRPPRRHARQPLRRTHADDPRPGGDRSEERRVGQEGVSTVRSWW